MDTLIRKSLITLFALIFSVVGCSSPKSTVNEQALFDQAGQAQAANKYQQAIAAYQQIIEAFPKSPRLDKALFMVGFIKYDNLKDTAGAVIAFAELVSRFPKSDLIDDANFMLESINSKEDPLTTFQKKVNP